MKAASPSSLTFHLSSLSFTLRFIPQPSSLNDRLQLSSLSPHPSMTAFSFHPSALIPQ